MMPYKRREQVCSYGLAQDCSNSIANLLELLQSSTKPSMCTKRDIKIILNQTLA